ncbi:5-methyltetrahydrofolate--homocysteine methyltransferase [Planctomycetales bacterium]|nr:5-methyltetrahydrofolate--homocysteine methyltransferase [Planctomycetales bacterium]GHT07199.1 5-methyltetrahydrofolate--homocysteine methyltransferase [Planctomycetales bacterium]
MNRQEFRARCLSRPLLLDGATGTELMKRGLPVGVCPELWAVEHPAELGAIAAAYGASGSDIVYACTFGGNRAKLEEFGLADRLVEINSRAVQIAKESLRNATLVAGDLAPTGKLIEPYGDFAFESAVEIFREQASALLAAGADLIVVETMLDIQEARAALIAVREIAPAAPVMVSLTFGDNGQTLTGTDPVTALVTLQALGADAFGCNCSVGPEMMTEWLRALKPYSTIPLFAKPNAGQPRIVNGKTVFPMDAAAFAAHFPALVAAGANLVGGCCGSSPEHLAAAATAIKNLPALPPPRRSVNAVTSMRGTVFIGKDAPFAAIGERINPTGKKKLAAELRAGKLTIARQFALEQTQNGAALLDVNMGAAGVDEKYLLTAATKILSTLTPCPLCLDTANPEAMAAALRVYPGRALLNSVSAEAARLEKMLPLARQYGAMAIVLPVTDGGVPETLDERKTVALKIIDAAERAGLARDDLVIDGVVMTASSAADAPRVTADFVEWCARDLQMATTAGVSNVSFGLPAREQLNLAFLGLLMSRGLSAALVNPSVSAMMDLAAATDALLNRDKNFARYLRRFAEVAPAATNDNAPLGATNNKEKSPREKVYACVIDGDDAAITGALQSALATATAQDLVDAALLPAINQVGDWFEKKIYFLPQLMLSAAALSAGFKFLEPLLTKSVETPAAKKIIMATVKGDIHDIGKNIVCLLLRNYGFDVVDLGKDVTAAAIVETALRKKITVVGLSALMTTTMTEMPQVIAYARAHGGEHLQFMVGGAAVDETFAAAIGAYYAADAVAAVKLAQRLTD